MTLQAVDVTETARDRALALVHAGLPISSAEFAAIQREGISQFHRKAKRGVYDDFLLKPATGTKRYSGVLIGRYLRGDVLEPATFGRRRTR